MHGSIVAWNGPMFAIWPFLIVPEVEWFGHFVNVEEITSIVTFCCMTCFNDYLDFFKIRSFRNNLWPNLAFLVFLSGNPDGITTIFAKCWSQFIGQKD